jgi:hypothetical protein
MKGGNWPAALLLLEQQRRPWSHGLKFNGSLRKEYKKTWFCGGGGVFSSLYPLYISLFGEYVDHQQQEQRGFIYPFSFEKKNRFLKLDVDGYRRSRDFTFIWSWKLLVNGLYILFQRFSKVISRLYDSFLCICRPTIGSKNCQGGKFEIRLCNQLMIYTNELRLDT